MNTKSMILNRILCLDKEEIEKSISDVINDHMEKIKITINDNIKSSIEQKLLNFYNSSDIESGLYDETFDYKEFRKKYYNIRFTYPSGLLETLQNKTSKCFTIKLICPNSSSHNGHAEDTYIFLEDNIILRINPSYSTNYVGWSLYSCYTSNSRIPNNILLGIKLFCKQKDAKNTGWMDEIDNSMLFFKTFEKNPEMFLDKCSQFEKYCKQEEYERKSLMLTLEKEKEEFDKERTAFYEEQSKFKELIGDYEKFQHEKKELEDEKKKLWLVKQFLNVEKQKIKEEREQLKSLEKNIDINELIETFNKK